MVRGTRPVGCSRTFSRSMCHEPRLAASDTRSYVQCTKNVVLAVAPGKTRFLTGAARIECTSVNQNPYEPFFSLC